MTLETYSVWMCVRSWMLISCRSIDAAAAAASFRAREARRLRAVNYFQIKKCKLNKKIIRIMEEVGKSTCPFTLYIQVSYEKDELTLKGIQ